MAAMLILNYYPINSQIQDTCYNRNICLSNCMTDNFPLVPCKPISNVSINYNGNLYTQFYSYPNPLKSYYSKSLNDSLFKNTTDDTAEREMAI